MSGGGDHEATPVRGLVIVSVLLALTVFLFEARVENAAFDAVPLIALGFVILAGFAIGELVGVIKLPHITGYLLAGLIFGESLAHAVMPHLPPSMRVAPFDEGLLNKGVTDQLSVLNTLAVALIALTAGGELRIETLRKGFRAIMGVLGGQLITIVVLVTGFTWAVLGGIPAISIPGVEGLSTAAALGLGLIMSSIAVATSPAATIAVITDARAEGEMTTTVLSSVILKDVIVVVFFAIASMLASQWMGLDTGSSNLIAELSYKVLVSIAVGAALGFGMALYLRFVGREVLLFITAVVYVATLLASLLHLDALLIFIAAGFTVANFSTEGHTLIDKVTQLSTPVYVVFFTLTGASLHLEDLVSVFPFAVALVVARAFAFFVGVGVGATLGGADAKTRKYGWLGFVSQAGVALSLAGLIGNRFGEPGEKLSVLIVAGVALNEILGPILLKVALGLAGETAARGTGEEEAPTPALDAEGAPESEPEHDPIASFPEVLVPAGDPWPEVDAIFSDEELIELLTMVRKRLRRRVEGVQQGSLRRFRQSGEEFLADLRREFLRHNRRLSIALRETRTATRQDGEQPTFADLFADERVAVASSWRSRVISRASRVAHTGWKPRAFIEAVDKLCASLPISELYKVEADSLRSLPGDGVTASVRRLWLRTKSGLVRLFGRDHLRRRVPVRSLAQYHLSYLLPTELEPTLGALIQADQRLTLRLRRLLELILEEPARGDEGEAAQIDYERFLREKKEAVERSFDEIQAEFELLTSLAGDSLGHACGRRLQALYDDYRTAGTPDLSGSDRRNSRVHRGRLEAIQRQENDLPEVRRSLAAGYSQLALEFELVGFESTLSRLMAARDRELVKGLRGRSFVQVQRFDEALEEALAAMDDAIEEARASDTTGAELAATLQQIGQPLEKVALETSAQVGRLFDDLSDEHVIGPLLESIRAASRELTDRYQVPRSGLRIESHGIPEPVPVVDLRFREAMATHVESSIVPALLDVTRKQVDAVRPFARSVQEESRGIAFNLELTNTELDLAHDQPIEGELEKLVIELLINNLERSHETLQGLVASSEKWAEEFGESIDEAARRVVSDLRGKVVRGELSELRVEILRRGGVGFREKARGIRLFFGQLQRAASRAMETFVGDAEREIWRARLGLKPDIVESDLAFYEQEVSSKIPLTYRRLFATDALEVQDVLPQNAIAIEKARNILQDRVEGRLRTVVAVGPDGTGKGAIVQTLLRRSAIKHVKRWTWTQPLTVADIDALFAELNEGALVAVEGFHWLVSRQLDGFAPLRTFVHQLIDNAGKNAFVLSVDSPVWRSACQSTAIGDAFALTIDVRPLSPTELQAAVMARHRLSGYGISFEREGGMGALEHFVARQVARIRRPYEGFFRQLYRLSGGRIRDALRIWLLAVEHVSESDDLIRMGEVPPSPVPALRGLEERFLLRLLQVTRQGWMDAQSLRVLFRLSRDEAAAELALLVHRGLLEPVGEHYRIPLALRGPLVQVFKERRWL